ncbi:MAG TPA: type II toxin-antitoxin system HicB family antitoxin [Solirubrobacterales bacterium]
MPTLASSNTVYTRPVAKVMISIPDKLLKRLDARATAAGETRSGLLQRLAERELDEQERRRQSEVKRLMGEIEDTFTADEPQFDVAQLIREDRDSR